MVWETVNVAETSRRISATMSPLSSHADDICGRDEGSLHAVFVSETRLSGAEELLVVELFSEVSVDDFL